MKTRAGVVALLSTVALAGCGVDPAALSLPGSSAGGPTYTIHIEFANALNLPSHARVIANGDHIGDLDKLTVADPTSSRPGSVIADVDIQQSVTLPSSTTAQLRQDTILGDIYISLDIPIGAPTSDKIDAGGTIPLERTEPALQVEDVLAGLATFVSGGALRSAQDAITRVNAALPADPAETARIADILKRDIVDVANNQGDLDAFIASIDTNARLILDNQDQLGQILTPTGVVDITEIAQSLIGVIGVIGALGGIVHALEWIAPLADSGDAAARAFLPMLLNTGRPLNLSAPSNLNRIIAFLRDKLIPWAERPTVNIHGIRTDTTVSAQPVSSDDQIDQVLNTLRMIGMVR
ncbi:MlaD family protein [Antrihabitans stalactiti]|uniref:MCE family protein n=1 Tax=Antrihabitans stalactiti TaxID=2584121 RepID=A0A848K9D5_9NOCA|nr:MlaD family protein [Antrihabitans stalactiti]NMN95525.1 MCE family protein [Antrihabitans stalactiti]